jgi:hypothetical protein
MLKVMWVRKSRDGETFSLCDRTGVSGMRELRVPKESWTQGSDWMCRSMFQGIHMYLFDHRYQSTQ